MRHLVVSLALLLSLARAATAFEIEDRRIFGPEGAPRILKVISTGDVDLFAPAIEAFLAARPGIAVDYVVASSTELMRALHDEDEGFDVALSSAMDLQTKLANDGGAAPHRSAATDTLPDWAQWRNHVFAFREEPAAIVLNRAAFDGIELPRTRQDLIAILRRYPERFRGRVGTYDVRRSGLGYLFATQDARTSETFWRLVEVMGAMNARLYCCSSEMIDDIASGRLAVAYNVLGSYAAAHRDRDRFHILLPTDFTTVMLRTALIPSSSAEPVLAGAFVDHLIELGGAVMPGTGPGADTRPEEASIRRIRLGPGLLVYLDRLKKNGFLKEWENAIIQD